MMQELIDAPTIRIDSEVTRRVRQHARAHMQAEVCGVLIGRRCDGVLRIEAPIEAFDAAQAGAHVTFTQVAWETIYRIKDREYPEDRIVGWYHSHPGFGVFLSEHDTFIHQNFFSSPDQVAWVYDPHSDEEGCFGWVGGSIRRIGAFHVADNRGGKRHQQGNGPTANPPEISKPLAVVQTTPANTLKKTSNEAQGESRTSVPEQTVPFSWARLSRTFLLSLPPARRRKVEAGSLRPTPGDASDLSSSGRQDTVTDQFPPESAL